MIWPLCMCGCGQTVPLAGKTNTRKGVVRGRPTRFVAGHYGGRKGVSTRKVTTDPEVLARRVARKLETQRTWYERNRARHSQTAMARYWREREAIMRHRRESGQSVRHSNARRARHADAFVEHVDPHVVFERDAGICGICGAAVDRDDWHLDHVKALARGGEHSYANVQVSHPRCNRQKGAR